MTPERRQDLALEELRRRIEQARALPGAARARAELEALSSPSSLAARAASALRELQSLGLVRAGHPETAPLLVAMAQAALDRSDRAGALRALEVLFDVLPGDHPQRAEVLALRERLSPAAGAASLLEGLEPAERAMAPGYLLMAAQDGELSAEETAALEDRLATADAGLRVEWAWLERARVAMRRVVLGEPPAAAWNALFAVAIVRSAPSVGGSVSRLAALRARGEDRVEPAGPAPLPERLSPGPEAAGAPVDDALADKTAAALSRLKGLRAGDVEGVRRVAASTSKVRLSDLERKGFREVKVLRAGDINQLIFKAVQRVFARQLSEDERDRVVDEARAALDDELDARRGLERLVAERDALLRGRDGDDGPVPRTVRRGEVVAAGLCLRAAEAPNGDWFDLVERGPRGVDVIVGDPSGRGAAAAVAQGCARSALLSLVAGDALPAQVLGAANRALCRTLPSGSFVSGALARCDGDGRVVLAGAGHEPGVVYRARERRAERLGLGGVVLGVLDRASGLMTDQVVELGPGDALVLVTDGVTEAASPDGTVFGEERLHEAVARHGHLDAAGLVAVLADEVRRWAGDRPLEDDVVVVAVQRVP